jgi:hypothetical protein
LKNRKKGGEASHNSYRARKNMTLIEEPRFWLKHSINKAVRHRKRNSTAHCRALPS